MGYRIGNGYKGSSALQTSVANAEILPAPPANWSAGSVYNFYKFNFVADADCTIIVNGEEIFLRSGFLFEVDSEDKPITSFKVKQSGITFSWMGAF